MALKIHAPFGDPKREIRVLYIDPPKQGCLSCRLEIVSLDLKPRPIYTALSWCWGKASRQSRMLLNTYEVDVPENAYNILQWLSKSCYSGPFWLDAVCINQRDLEERGHQVTLMRRLYSEAAKVLILLDLDGAGSADRAIASSLSAIVTQCRGATNDLRDLKDRVMVQEGSVKKLVHSNEPLPASCDWTALMRFFACPWFTRLWVVQEAVLAKDAECVFGSLMLNFNDVAVAGVWMNHRKYWNGLQRGPGTIGIDNSSLMWHRSALADGFYPSLMMGTSFQCTDPRDQVYAILGLGTDAAVGQIVPDYTKSISDIYIEATRASIAEKGHLHILAYANAMDIPSKLTGPIGAIPSWIPRFDLNFARAGNSYRPARMQFGIGADDDLPLQVKDDSLSSEVLNVRGLVVDTVVHVSAQMTENLVSRNLSNLFDELHRISFQAAQSFARRYSRQIDFRSAMLRTLTTGPLHDADSTNENDLLRKDYYAFLSVLGLDRYNPDGTEAVTEAVVSEDVASAERFLNAIWLHSINRRFLVTESGYIGMGPRDVQGGDQVCILFGSRVPFVLRADAGQHRLVGDAYIEGIMQGEHVRSLKETNGLDSVSRQFEIV